MLYDRPVSQLLQRCDYDRLSRRSLGLCLSGCPNGLLLGRADDEAALQETALRLGLSRAYSSGLGGAYFWCSQSATVTEYDKHAVGVLHRSACSGQTIGISSLSWARKIAPIDMPDASVHTSSTAFWGRGLDPLMLLVLPLVSRDG